MGIKNLSLNFKRKYPQLYKTCRLTKFAGHRIGIDVSIWFYAFKNAAIKQALYNTDLSCQELDYKVVSSYWLQRFHEQMMMFIDCDVMPIPVFDGKPLRLKKGTKENRKKDLEGRKETIEALKVQIANGDYDESTIEDLENNLKCALWTTREEVVMLKKMFDDMGVFYHQSDTEAERDLAELCKQGYCSAVYTRDSDAFVYRTPVIITDVEKKTRLGKPCHKCTYVVFENVMKLLNMEEIQFVDFCIMCGTDYNSNLAVLKEGIKRGKNTDKFKPPSFGYSKAFDLISKHGTIEVVIENIKSRGYVIGYYKAIEYLEEYGPKAAEFFEEMREEDKFEHKDITYHEIREEIRGYFLIPPELNLERDPVHYVTGNMKICFSEILFGPNKKRMLEEADRITEKLLEFEERFNNLQIFTLTYQSDVN